MTSEAADVALIAPAHSGSLSAAVAAKLSRWAEDRGAEGAWYWLEGGSLGEPQINYLGIASDVVSCGADVDTGIGVGVGDEFVERLKADSGAGSDETTLPFAGGWVVALGYEFGVSRMGISTQTEENGVRALGLQARAVLVVNDETETIRLVTSADESSADWRDVYQAILNQSVGNQAPVYSDVSGLSGSQKDSRLREGTEVLANVDDESPRVVTAPVQWQHTDAGYEKLIRESQRLISEGEAYVLCLTNRGSVRLPNDSVHSRALRVFHELNRRSEAPRAGLIVTNDLALISASPERFLSIRGRRVRSAPIKGTRPRGETAAEDARLATELQSSPKERAENTMIVDLLRNDLSRVCEPASVVVESLCQVESYRQVHQLVSVVSGNMLPGSHVWDVIDSTFPGGSMTGAPKRRAIEHLSTLEAAPRGLYSGCFGWIDGSGSAELAMTIRSIELSVGDAVIGAGGGITIDSDPSDEVSELHLKARAMLQALAPEIE